MSAAVTWTCSSALLAHLACPFKSGTAHLIPAGVAFPAPRPHSAPYVFTPYSTARSLLMCAPRPGNVPLPKTTWRSEPGHWWSLFSLSLQYCVFSLLSIPVGSWLRGWSVGMPRFAQQRTTFWWPFRFLDQEHIASAGLVCCGEDVTPLVWAPVQAAS
jgi:hypothetical protein